MKGRKATNKNRTEIFSEGFSSTATANRPNIAPEPPIKGELNLLGPHITDLVNSVKTGQQLVPLGEEDVALATEMDMNGVGFEEQSSAIWRAYKKDWLNLTNLKMWRNIRPHLRKDPKPISIVVGYQHLPFIEEQIRRLNLG